MVQRVFVEKREGLAFEASNLLAELTQFAGLEGLRSVRVINRYDVEGLSPAEFEAAIPTVFSEPPLDTVSRELKLPEDACAFALEYLPGQFDQRADSAAQCLQMQTLGDKPLVRTARVFVLQGNLSPEDVDKAKGYLLNPVESREAGFDLPDSLKMAAFEPELPPVLNGFREMDEQGMKDLRESQALAMEEDDLLVMVAYFQ
ncbi:MAG: phosphoribosylformylglycinamidine synthase, partial [Clostridiales bacterium]|nr:phosphoribosylformylglycinamidine synthase [Clostridiales bacterium]